MVIQRDQQMIEQQQETQELMDKLNGLEHESIPPAPGVKLNYRDYD